LEEEKCTIKNDENNPEKAVSGQAEAKPEKKQVN